MSKKRPLSPHLQVYRPQLTSIMSISHRASGVALVTGTIILCLWLVALAAGEVWFGLASAAVEHPLGQIVLFGYSLALIYHALNGVRHLAWDKGLGLSIPAVYMSGYIVLAFTIVITAALWTLLV
jgi:succinate dehydrogenase / fumarate reductase cytochrome b subunit